MSTCTPSPAVAGTTVVPQAESAPALAPPAQHARSARIRAATVRRQLLLATDALAAAHLLLGIHRSLSQVGVERKDEA